MTDLQSSIKEAASLYRQKKYGEASAIYRKCINEMTDEQTTKEATFTEKLTQRELLEYMLCLCLLESKEFDDWWEAFKHLYKVKTTYECKFPAIYYALTRTYLKFYRFSLVKIMIDEGLAVLEAGTLFADYHIPETNIIIDENTKKGLYFKLTDLRNKCSQLSKPDAYCNLKSMCKDSMTLKMSFDISVLDETNNAIYIGDPTSKGMVTVFCSSIEPCILQYHSICWKHQKYLCNVTDDMDMFNLNCFTKDCNSKNNPSKIIQIEFIGQNGETLKVLSSRKRKNSYDNTEEVGDLVREHTQEEISEMKRENVTRVHVKCTYIPLKEMENLDTDKKSKKTVDKKNKCELSTSNEEKDILKSICTSVADYIQENDEIANVVPIKRDTTTEFLVDDLCTLSPDECTKDESYAICESSFTSETKASDIKYDRAIDLEKEIKSYKIEKQISPDCFARFNISPTKSLSPVKSNNDKSPDQHSTKLSQSKSLSEKAFVKVGQIKKNVEKWTPSIFKRSNSMDNGEKKTFTSSKKMGAVDGLPEVASPTVKRRILFEDCANDEYVENKNDTAVKSHHHKANEYVIVDSNKLEDGSKFEDGSKLENANTKKASLINICKILTDKKKPDKRIKRRLTWPELKSCSQCVSVEKDYSILQSKLEDINEKKLKDRKCCEHESLIPYLSSEIDDLKKALTTLKEQFGTKDPVIEHKIMKSSLEEYRNLILESVVDNKNILMTHYKAVLECEKKEIIKEKDAIIHKHEMKNIELSKELEMNKKELDYVKTQLESTSKAFFDFKKQILEKRLFNFYDSSIAIIRRTAYFYDTAINLMERMQKVFKMTIGENLIYGMDQMTSWCDNVFYLQNEIKNCEVLYQKVKKNLDSEEYIRDNNDILWVKYKLPLYSTHIMASYVENAFLEYYNKITEKWCQDISCTPQGVLSDQASLEACSSIYNDDSKMEDHYYVDIDSYSTSEAKKENSLTVSRQQNANEANNNSSFKKTMDNVSSVETKQDKCQEIEKSTKPNERQTDDKIKINQKSEKEAILNKANEDINKELIRSVLDENYDTEVIASLNNDNYIINYVCPKKKKDYIVTDCEKQTTGRVTMNEMTSTSDKELILNKEDKDSSERVTIEESSGGNIDKAMITNEINRAVDEELILNQTNEVGQFILCESNKDESVTVKESSSGNTDKAMMTNEINRAVDEELILNQTNEVSEQLILCESNKDERVTVKESSDGSSDKAIMTNEINRAIDEELILNQTNEVSEELILYELNKDNHLRTRNPSSESFYKFGNLSIVYDVEEIIMSELNNGFNNKENDNATDVRSKNILRHDMSDSWTQTMKHKFNTNISTTTIYNKKYVHMTHINSDDKYIYQNNRNINMFNKNERKHKEIEINAINNLLSEILQKYPHFTSTDAFDGIMDLLDMGVRISEVDKEMLIDELYYIISEKENCHYQQETKPN
ncbi:putative leucine-rich repeat-containing protein DDB_G0290503 isoform X2 [Harpegnathos saltator]|uniref:putative leucine-rich repeat-containing protein DDB_G0290503 isoform X2 n=1 Tax=Harpegnathos saltator TaxID=610380 RepID=UPI00058B8DAD|nr:putative leucine-rich repeat-containing protein DDB_G0290503 isoform X2 [Harpegnathos saltator]